MQIINTTNIEEARKQINAIRTKDKDTKIAVLSQEDEFNRKVLEIKGINMIVINESLYTRDYMKQRNSGLNEVLIRICKNKNISIGIELDKIIEKEDIEKAKSLSRLMQNIMLCRKGGVKIVFLSVGDVGAAQALFLSLGASTKQASESIN